MVAILLLALLVAPSLGDHLPLIVGGKDVAAPGTYPHQGSLQFLGSHSCGCSLVSATWVITAGHCILYISLQDVILGAHDIETLEKGDPTTYTIKEAFVHPDYDGNADGFPNDVALIELSSAANTNSEFIGTVAMAPAAATDADFSNCLITGWGDTKKSGYPDILQEADVGIYSKSTCEDMFDNIGGATINAGHICIGTATHGACSGDSGGPLMCEYKGSDVLAGLTSWGISTCDTKYPSVYTRVSYFRTWIDGIMGGY